MDYALVKAKLAEKGERYDEMADVIKEYLSQRLNERPPSADVRNLFAVAMKNSVAQRRMAWRVLTLMSEKETERGSSHGVQCIMEYRQEIEREIIHKCDEVVSLCNAVLDQYNNELDDHERTLFLRLKGDFSRYIAELQTPRRSRAIEDTQTFYNQALETRLPPNHHTTLGVILNKAIFLYEELNRRDEAIRMLQEALRHNPTPINESNRRNVPTIFCLIDTNLKNWMTQVAAN